MNNEVQHILSRTKQIRFGTIIQTIANYLRSSQTTSTLAKESKHRKSEETESLKNYITENNLWVNDLNLNNYVSEGAEQKVYLKDS